MFNCASAAASLMSGSNPVKSPVTRSTGIGASVPSGFLATPRLCRYAVYSVTCVIRIELPGPRLLPVDAAALHAGWTRLLVVEPLEFVVEAKSQRGRLWKYLGSTAKYMSLPLLSLTV